MVVFVDLDDESIEPSRISDWQGSAEPGTRSDRTWRVGQENYTERSNPNLNPMTEAMGCYPVIILIAQYLDLNSLDSLAITCRQVRSNLLQYRSQLISQTLRCCNEEVVPNKENTLRFRARAADWYFVDPGGARIGGEGKVGSCARDLVGGCGRCGKVVCRNCTIKPPAPVLLAQRLRRLCPTCLRAPLDSMILSSSSTSKSSRETHSSHNLAVERLSLLSNSSTSSFSTHPTVSAPPTLSSIISRICSCHERGVYLCQPCGRGLRSADTTYDSIWRWRVRYDSALGGLGTGFGEGNRSFVCGRAEECLAGRWVEEEVDCDADDAREIDALDRSRPRDENGSTSSSSYGSTGSNSMGPGYLRHEIEGIGGVVKLKKVRMVKVGACVTEWEDEKEAGRYLVREHDGRSRSWCGWCLRVVVGEKDRKEIQRDINLV